MPVSVREVNGEIYVPIAILAELINNYCPVSLNYSRFKRTLTLKLTDVNITGIEIEQRTNGTLIHIPAIEPFFKRAFGGYP
jgi:hypothetical protein